MNSLVGWVVIKLGGTSVSRATYWARIAEELDRRLMAGERLVVVQSALTGVTDRLAVLAATTDRTIQEEVLTDILQRHLTLAEELCIDPSVGLEPLIARLRALITPTADTGERTPRWQAEVMAHGELLASILGALYLQSRGLATELIDARTLLQTHCQPNQSLAGQYLSAACDSAPNHALAEHLAACDKVVLTQGFIASNACGETVLLGRGGSDTSAAYLAARLQAQRLEIWTDVPGLFSANPHEITSARLLKQLDYDEAQEIALTGAKVLHPRCLEPVKRHGIPLHILYTPNPTLPGTVIGPHPPIDDGQCKAISLRGGVTLVTLQTLGMWRQVGFLADVFQCFKARGLSVDMVSTSETCVTVSLDPLADGLSKETVDQLASDLNKIGETRILHGCAAVSIVGRNLRANLHRLAPALQIFEEHSVHLVSQAANDLNLTFVVNAEDGHRLAWQLHRLLIDHALPGTVHGPTLPDLLAHNAPPSNTVKRWWNHKRDALLQLAADKTPLYVYDRISLQQAVAEWFQLKAVDKLFYAVKANCHPDVLAVFHAAGLGFECVSRGELDHVLTLFPGLPRERLLFTPNFAPREEYAHAMAVGARVTLDSLYPLGAWPELFREREILLRFDPGQGAGHHAYVRTAGPTSKFGIPMSERDTAVALVERVGVRVLGLHAHVGSGLFDPGIWRSTAEQLHACARSFPDARILDLGGGFGVPEQCHGTPFDLSRLGALLATFRHANPQYDLWLEPGRLLTAPAGVLLTRVTQTKAKDGLQYIGVDTGMNSLLRPALYRAHHEIVNLSRLDDPATSIVTVVGPICETGDVLGTARPLPRTKEGDLLLIANTGAYGRVMASSYNLRPPATEVVI